MMVFYRPSETILVYIWQHAIYQFGRIDISSSRSRVCVRAAWRRGCLEFKKKSVPALLEVLSGFRTFFSSFRFLLIWNSSKAVDGRRLVRSETYTISVLLNGWWRVVIVVAAKISRTGSVVACMVQHSGVGTLLFFDFTTNCISVSCSCLMHRTLDIFVESGLYPLRLLVGPVIYDFILQC